MLCRSFAAVQRMPALSAATARFSPPAAHARLTRLAGMQEQTACAVSAREAAGHGPAVQQSSSSPQQKAGIPSGLSGRGERDSLDSQGPHETSR